MITDRKFESEFLRIARKFVTHTITVAELFEEIAEVVQRYEGWPYPDKEKSRGGVKGAA